MSAHTRTKIGLALSSALMLGGALASPAVAATMPLANPSGAADEVQVFGNMATGSCLDDSEFGLRGYQCNGGPYQKWSIHVWNDGTRQLRNVATNRCLDDSEVGLRTFGCNDLPYQSWWVTHHASDSISLQNQFSNKCLDDSEFGLRTFGCSGGGNRHQLWR